ncbi:ABC transporter permease [Perlabentimonas gracilis]|uniref:ABC transporter permease n=1 Tax=Perlabentimonas gracilis TaxID=2715279 RepID=UPI00140C14F3|nr:ABC transporter permease [Perlabentimonas gracilis]NHB67942.1 FtsX-like permease family protein [Perlabentimonas gracilis]
MLNYNLKTALKFLRKNKAFAAINLIGLSIALAVSFIIILHVVNELTYDSCHKNRKDVYRVFNTFTDVDISSAITPYVLASTLKAEYPQVREAINTRQHRDLFIKQNEELISIKNPIATSSSVFDVFTIPLVSSTGTDGFLDDKYSICLSQNLAHKLFGDGDAVGKEVTTIVNNEEQILRVTAVYKDMPQNSSLRADCLINDQWTVAQVNSIDWIEGSAETSWGSFYFWTTWVLLDPDINPHSFSQNFRELESRYLGENRHPQFFLQNLSDVYLRSDNINSSGLKGSMKDVRLFSIIAILIVVVAAINYIILSTAVSVGRTKEMAVRKTNGARNAHVFHQLLTESTVLVLLVLPLAFFLMMQGLPYANELFQKQITLIGANIPIYLVVYLGSALLIGGISGLYTSLWLSRQKVMSIFNNQVSTGRSKNYFRSILIILQLVIFSTFVSCMLIVRHQYQFALKMDPGFHNENVLFLEIGDNFNQYNALMQELKSNPNIKMAGGTYAPLPSEYLAGFDIPHYDESEMLVVVDLFDVDINFLETVGISLAEGRFFSENLTADSAKCIINQAAVNKLGIKNPLGKSLLDTWEVIGVVNDFYTGSIEKEVSPMLIIMSGYFINQVAIQYLPGSLNVLLPSLQSTWQRLAPNMEFRYSLVEDLIQKLYAKEQNLTVVVTLSAFFILLVALFGLFGLTLFIAQRRTKEIGIRKVLGSSASQIVFSFIKTNLLYVLIAVVISTPITIMVMQEWLNNYVERIDIGWWVFALTFAIAALVVVLTVLAHSYRAAKVNPVEALRYE